MTDREKLIKLLMKSPVSGRKTLEDYMLLSTIGDIADYLISKGVTIPVRCGECKHWHPSNARMGDTEEDMQAIGGCVYTRYCRREKDFCSCGERKEDENNN